MDVLPVIALLHDTARHVTGIVNKAAADADDESKRRATQKMLLIVDQIEATLKLLHVQRAPLTSTARSPTRVPPPPVLPWSTAIAKSRSKVAPAPGRLAPVKLKPAAQKLAPVKLAPGNRPKLPPGLPGQNSRVVPVVAKRRLSLLSAVIEAYKKPGQAPGVIGPTNHLARQLSPQLSLAQETYSTGSLIVGEGVYLRCMYLIKSGTVEIWKNGINEKPVAELEAPSYFGEISLFCGRPTTASVRAKTPTTVWVLPQDRLSILKQKFPDTSRLILQTASERLRNDIRAQVAERTEATRDFRTMLCQIDEQVLNLRVRETYLLDPNSRFLQQWEVLLAVCLVYVVFMTPYEAAFLRLQWNYLFWVNRAVDLVFLVDMLLTFFLPYEKNNFAVEMHHFVKDHRKIVRHYLRSYFAIDFVGLMASPVDVLAINYRLDHSFGVRLLRLLKLVRMVKIHRFLGSAHVTNVLANSNLISYRWLNLVGLLVMVCTLSHIMAASAGLMAKLEGIQASTWVSVWAARHGVDEVCKDKLGAAALGENAAHWENCYAESALYTAALYWAVKTITSIGFGDIVPENHNEQSACIVAMLLGGCVWAYAIGSICALASKHDAKVVFQSKMDSLNKSMNEMDLGSDFRVKMRSYFLTARNRFRKDNNSSLMSYMSPELSFEWAMNSQAGKCMHQISFAKNLVGRHDCRHFLVRLVSDLGYQVFTPGETIYTDSTLFIILKGLGAHNGRIFRKNSVWGDDIGLASTYLMELRHVFCLTYVFVNYLPRKPFLRALEEHKEAAAIVRRHTIRLAVSRAIRLTVMISKASRQQSTASVMLPTLLSPASRTRMLGTNKSSSQMLWHSKQKKRRKESDQSHGPDLEPTTPKMRHHCEDLAFTQIPNSISGFLNATVRWEKRPDFS